MRPLLLLLPLVLALPACGQSVGWDMVRGQIRRDFAQVRQIPPDTLAAWQRDARPLVLLDVRRPDEYAVSHLAGARNVSPDAPASVLAGVSRNARVVAYCSVGWRSSAFADRLRKAGYADVSNLDGSIFRWANEGRPVVDDSGRAVRAVHPYDRLWGRLLHPSLRASR